MLAALRIPLRGLKRFGRDNRAAAAVEFALILPFLILLFTGSLEASSLITVDRRINVISGTIGDLVSRWDPDTGSISSSTLTDYFKASQGIIFPYSTTGLKQVVTVIEVSSTGVTKVKWSCAYNGGTARATNAVYSTLPAKFNELARPPGGSGYVVASEVSYSYKPVLGMVFTNALNLTNESFYLPRYQAYITGPGSC